MQLHAEPPRNQRIHGDMLYALDPDELVEIVLPPRRASEVVGDSGSAFEAFAGALAIAAAVIALAGYGKMVMPAVAAVAVGFGLLARASSLATRGEAGVATELCAGLLGIGLGLVAIFGVEPATTLPVVSLILGGALLRGGPLLPITEAPSRVVTVMTGFTAVVLGLVSLIAGGPILILAAISMLVLGASFLLSGASRVVVVAQRSD